MPDLDYLDFDLMFERAGDGSYRVVVTRSPAGSARAEFVLPFSDVEIENVFLKLGGARRRVRRVESAEMDTAKQFGGKLFNAVFTGDVRGVFAASAQEANTRNVGLRIRLHLDQTPELQDLPWEFLYNSSLNRFLALSNKTPIVRYIELPEPIRPLTVSPPLRVLVMISNPTDYEPLDVEREWNNLQTALSDLVQRGTVVLERLDSATVSELQSKLQERAYHIFHFIGHGVFDERTQDGVLIFEGTAARGRRVSAQTLGTILHDHGSLRLAVLNACEGARTSRSDSFAGVAQSLVQQGIPAVLAMQFEISDDAAAVFARGLYQAIARGLPLDAALGDVRKNIFADNNETEWGTPVLYLRAADGKIFNVQEMTVAFDLPSAQNKAPVLPEAPAAHTILTEPVIASPTRDLSKNARRKKYVLPIAAVLVVAVVLLGIAFASGIFFPRTAPGGLGCTPDATFTDPVVRDTGPVVVPGTVIQLDWQITNTGTCVLDEYYGLQFYSGDAMDWKWTQPKKISPGETVSSSMKIVAPLAPGNYRIQWYYVSPESKAFGARPILKYTFQVVDGAMPTTAAQSAIPTPGITVETRGTDNAPMVFVPAGVFPMGSNQGDVDERPVHDTFLDAFWIDRYEVTNAQFKHCVDAGICHAPPVSGSSTRDVYYDKPEFDDYPVIYVSWDDAKKYCEWARKRLPTEAEWEKAARGTEGRIFPWGDRLDRNLVNYMNLAGDTMAVNNYSNGASPYGALNMAGNVSEWVSDWYDADYYSNATTRNPIGAPAGKVRGLRGGSWASNEEYYIRTTVRLQNEPGFRNTEIGFRCAQ